MSSFAHTLTFILYLIHQARLSLHTTAQYAFDLEAKRKPTPLRKHKVDLIHCRTSTIHPLQTSTELEYSATFRYPQYPNYPNLQVSPSSTPYPLLLDAPSQENACGIPSLHQSPSAYLQQPARKQRYSHNEA